MSILVIAEHDHATLKPATRAVVTAAAQLGGEIHLLIAGHACDGAVQEAARLQGVARVRVADAAHYAAPVAENEAALLLPLLRDGAYSHILAAASSHGRNMLPRVAALLDVAPVSDVVAIDAPDTFVRPIYAGNALATVQSVDAIKVITVRPTAFAAVASLASATAAIETLAAGPDPALVTVRSRMLRTSARPELGAARVVVAGGRGLASASHYRDLLEPLADKLGAALAASRAAVDAGFAPNDCQVGQTGRIVAPQLYVAVGISGAIQHLAGMKDSQVIVAINKDAEAPIFQVADYGLVGDLFSVVPELTAAL